jgi:hypothetical protein
MRRMRGSLAAIALLLALAGLAGCGTKRPPHVAPVPPPAATPPSLLASHPLAVGLVGWPPVAEPVAVAALVAETPVGRPGRSGAARERTGSAPRPEVPTPPAVLPSLMVPALDEAVAVREVRANVALARRALQALRYDRLSPDARAQYDTVAALIEEAEDALKARNFVYAVKVADKAATLARRLGGSDEAAGAPAGRPK